MITTRHRTIGFFAVLCLSTGAVSAASAESAPCLPYSAAALPAARNLVAWPDDSARIAIAPGDGTVLVGDPFGRIMGWLSGASDRAVIYVTRGQLVSVTRYGAFYAFGGKAAQRTEIETGDTGYDPAGAVPTPDAVAAWGDDAGRYVAVLRQWNDAPIHQQIMVLDDCVVSARRRGRPSAEVEAACAQGALAGGTTGNLPGSRAVAVSTGRRVTHGWIGAGALVTLEESIGNNLAPDTLVVRELASFKTRSETPMRDVDVLVAGDALVEWDAKARTLSTSSLKRPAQSSSRVKAPWASDECWRLAGASASAAVLRCGLVDKSRWRVVDLRTGQVTWSADAHVGGVRVDDRGTVWAAREDGVCRGGAAGSK